MAEYGKKEFWTFVAFIRGNMFFVQSVKGDRVGVVSRDDEYAKTHSFAKTDQGAWTSEEPIEAFDGFQVLRSTEESSVMEVSCVKKSQLLAVWNLKMTV